METVIKEEIASLRSDSNNLFIFLMAVLTGSATVMYQTLNGSNKYPAFLFMGIVGLIIVFAVYGKIRQIKYEIDDKIAELRELSKDKK
jgi:Ca2+/Na+ antiporter